MNVGVPITLEHHFFPRISISANPNYVAHGKPLDATPISAQLNVTEANGGKNRFMVELRLNVLAGPDNGLPYSLDILCVGYVTIPGELPKDLAAKQVVLDIGHRMLFPAVRELILSLTARQPWGQFSIGVGVLGTEQTAPGESTAIRKSTKGRKALTQQGRSVEKKSDIRQAAVRGSARKRPPT